MAQDTLAPEAPPSAPVFEFDASKIVSRDQITYLVRARQPLIYVVSSEEKRVEAALTLISEERKRKIVFWSATRGFYSPSSQEDGSKTDPIDALKHMMEAKESALYVLRDFHEFIAQAHVKRHLRDLAREFENESERRLKTCILVSPVQKIPPEIEKEFAVVDYDLPTLEDVKKFVSKILVNVGPLLEKDPKAAQWKRSFESDPAQQLKVAEAALGLSEVEINSVLARSLIMVKRFDLPIIHSEKEQIIRKSGTLEFLRPDASFAGVGGLELMKDWLRKRAKAFTKEAREFGLPEPRGILMLGIPGCGKSLMAKSVASLWQLPLVRLDVGKCMGSLVGASEEGMRKAIKTAESVAPCILWLDELEKGLAGSQSSGQTDGGTTARVFGTFITWLQEKTSPVFVIGTANNVKMLPSELLRKGRFDEIFFVDLPSKEERKQIFEIHIKRRKRDPLQFNIDSHVDQTEGFSGSEIEQVVISALYDAFDEGCELEDRFIGQAVEETVPLSRTMVEEITSMRDWAKSRARLASTPVQLEEKDTGRKLEI